MRNRVASTDETIVSHPYPTADDAIRAIQGLKGAGIDDRDIRIASWDGESAAVVADVTGASVGTWHDSPDTGEGPLIVSVAAGDSAELARRVMHDGLVIGEQQHAAGHARTVLDSSVGSGAAIATGTGTATGASPGAGYQPNTGSTTGTTPGSLGQYAPGADTPDEDDDFPR